MIQNSCYVHLSKLCDSKRKTIDETCVIKKNSELFITYCEGDTLDKFESDINLISGNSSFFYFLKKKFFSMFISILSVLVILIAFLSVSIYEDFFKKIVFETPFLGKLMILFLCFLYLFFSLVF